MNSALAMVACIYTRYVWRHEALREISQSNSCCQSKVFYFARLPLEQWSESGIMALGQNVSIVLHSNSIVNV